MAKQETTAPPTGQQVDADAVIHRLAQRIAALELDLAVRDSIIAQLQSGAGAES